MRAISILLFSLLLVGCPAYFSASVKNQSGNSIVMDDYKSSSKIVIEPGFEKEVSWGFKCQKVTLSDGSEKHLIPGTMRIGTYETAGPVTKFNIIFKDDHFFYLKSGGELIPIQEAESC